MVAYVTGGVFLQVWIGVKDKLPRMLTAVYLDDPLHLRHRLEMSNWQLDAPVPADAFASSSATSAKHIRFAHPNAKRFAEIARVTKECFHMEEQPNRNSRVEGGRGGSSRQEAEGAGEKTFNDLPADAKAAADRLEPRLVGKKVGQFPDTATYRKQYANEYFRKYPNG